MTTAVRYVGVPDGPTRRIDTFGRDAVTGTDLAALKRAFRSHNHSRLLQVRVDRRGMTYCRCCPLRMIGRTAMSKKHWVASTVAACAVGGAALAAAPTASATTWQDAQFVSCTAAEGVYNTFGTGHAAEQAHAIATDIVSGIRDPLQERDWLYQTNGMPNFSLTDANVVINCVTDVYLGFGPSHGTTIDGTLA